jgi:hypothetical protein
MDNVSLQKDRSVGNSLMIPAIIQRRGIAIVGSAYYALAA